MTGIDGSATAVQDYIDHDLESAYASIFSDDDRIVTSTDNDYLRGYDGNDFINATGGDDVLLGERGLDRLYGGNGADYLDGGTGGDLMAGGNGNDRYFSDNSNDRIRETNAAGTDTIFTSVSRPMDANVENLYLTGTGSAWAVGNVMANAITGNNTDNALAGGDGDDWLSGGAGNDRLNGGAGADHLVGGAGADMFIFTDPVGQDVVHGFERGVDKLNVAAIDANTAQLGDQAFTYIGSAEFTDAPGQLRYNGDQLSGDVDGDGESDFGIAIGNHVPLHQGDLIL